MAEKNDKFKFPRRSFLVQLRNLAIITSLQSFSSKVFAVSGARMRKAKRAILASGPTLWTWGDSLNGKLGYTGSHRSSPTQVGSLTDWTSIATGEDHGLAIRAGTLWSFGRNHIGQLGNGTTSGSPTSSPVQIGSGSDWKKVGAGWSFSLATKTDNTLWTWGNGNFGRLGHGNTTSYSSPVQVGTLSNWDTFDGGYGFTAAVKTDGTLWMWGLNDCGQLGDGTVVSKSSPFQLGSATNWKKVATGYDYCIGLKTNGTIWTWGSNSAGHQGYVISSPTQVDSVNNWSMVVARKKSSVTGDGEAAGGAGIRTNGTLWTWGFNNDGQIGTGTTAMIVESPVQVGSDTDWALVAVGPWTTAAIKTNGTLWTWGYNNSGELGLGDRNDRSVPTQVGALSDWSKISIGESFMVAVKSDNSLWSWGGSGNGGVLGNTSVSGKRSSPMQVGALLNWSKVVCGPRSTAAIKTDGTLWTWGIGLTNQLGTGGSSTVSSPVQIGTDTGWTFVSKGMSSGLGIIGGALWGWGNNADGQLGQGVKTIRSVPVVMPGATDWAYVTVGQYDTLGIRTDGSLWVWGTSSEEFNFHGMSNYAEKLSPVRIGSDTDWSMVEIGEQGVLALKGGKLWSWGRPFKGALGHVVLSPRQLGSLTTWTDVSAANYHTAALQSNGTLWAWGYNNDGQIGTGGAYEGDALPVKVGTASTWTKICVGGYSTAAIRADGTAWAWGYNNRGQLGDGNNVSRSNPNMIGTATNWTEISVSEYHMMSIRS